VVEPVRELRLANRGKSIHLVMDNARYQRCGAVSGAARKYRIRLVYLPPYSPNLNLIERFWKLLRKKVLQNRYYQTFDDHAKAIDNFIREVNAGLHEREMNSLITLNFQQFQDSHFAVA
jgi:transposase